MIDPSLKLLSEGDRALIQFFPGFLVLKVWIGRLVLRESPKPNIIEHRECQLLLELTSE